MTRLYGWFAIFGLAVVASAFLMGFRHDPTAPSINYVYNFGLMAGYMIIHVVMMMPAYKRLVCGNPDGSPGERRVYVVVATTTWLAVYAIHFPLPGAAFEFPAWTTYAALTWFLLSYLAFNEGGTFDSMKGFTGVPGYEQSHSAAANAPLLTEGSYASVRHPMYRGYFFLILLSVVIHPNGAQLAWALLFVVQSFVSIPFEERHLLAGRGEEYRRYMKQTPYRLLRGIW